MSGTTARDSAGLETLAREKMSRVLGASRAEQLYGQIMAEVQLEALGTPDDLMRFARALTTRGGFEGSVGALLCVQATIRGAQDN
jgi:hypothetical protein